MARNSNDKTKIKPTEGGFDTEEARIIFARRYFWKVLSKQQVFVDWIKKIVPKFNPNLSFTENQRNLYKEIRDWQKENNIFNNQETHWLKFWIFHFIEFKAKFPNNKDTDFQNLSVKNGIPYYPPRIKGLHIWLWGEDSPEQYIENQRLQALDDLERTIFSSLPPYAKTYIANERVKQAKSYVEEVKAQAQKDGFVLKATAISRKFEEHLRWLFEVYFDQKQFSEIAEKYDEDVTNVSREVNKLSNLLGFSKASHIKQGRKKGSKNNQIISSLGKK